MLDETGCTTVRIIFNAGDRLFHEKARMVSYAGTMTAWLDWFESFVGNFNADAVLLFGDQRPIHRAAIDVCNRLGIPVISFEEGYLRPSYITMERGGNNAHSPMRKWRMGKTVPQNAVPHCQMIGNGFPQIARLATSYFVAMNFGRLSYPYYKHHRHRPLPHEALLWSRNAFRKWRYRVRDFQKIQWIVENLDGRYFIGALQVHDDLQVRSYGRGWTVEKMMESAVASFAEFANPADHLVFKGHPLDRGHSASRHTLAELADLYQVADRVHFVDDGSLGLLARHSRGMLTINSTSAMVSFNNGRPVFALGDCFYEALTVNRGNQSREALARFWRAAPLVDKKAWRAFCADLVENSLIEGSFYIENEIEPTCQNVCARMFEWIEQHKGAGHSGSTAYGYRTLVESA